MHELEQWQSNNEEYLSRALTWLRLRLAQQVAAPSVVVEKRSWWSRLGSGLQRQTTVSVSIPVESPSNGKVSRAAEAMVEAEKADAPPALILLGRRFRLSRFELHTLLLCAAMELDTRIARLCAQAQDNANQPYPTFALALSLFDDPAWDALSPERPLRYWRLLEINQPGVQPLTTSALRADERIVNYIKGLNYLDDRLAPLLVPLEVVNSPINFPPSQQKAVDELAHYLQQTNAQYQPIIQLLGTDSLTKQLVAQQVANQVNLFLYRLPVELLPSQVGDLETFDRLWQRESLLLPIALYLDAHETDTPAANEGKATLFYRFLSRSHGLMLLSSREVRPQLGRSTVLVDIDKPTPSEQRQLWMKALQAIAPDSANQLAGQFNLNQLAIQQIVQAVVDDPFIPPENVHTRLWNACLASARPQMDLLAQRLDSKATWADIVLPAEETALLHQIADQVQQRNTVYEDWGFHNRMNRGMGISALFAGESGTGKTMAAEVIANDLQLNLYRIDLSAVVSKYIGETEKNLRRLFDAAEDGGAILFFDEADALFGKRSEVKDSHDRYANIEINYLLQRMEAFRGLAILATNMKSSLDHAFVRRLRFIVNFTFPTPTERKSIWQRAFPPETPVEELDCDRLARLNLTGGSIHNVALNAAFLAAQAKTPVTMPVVLAAARTEFRKLDRPINETDFRWQEPTGVKV